jgi:adenylosuccinate synthase
VLDAFKELSLCTGYKINGEISQVVPFQMTRHDIEPVLETLPGWNSASGSIKSRNELPTIMNEYVEFINKYLGVSVSHISNGPERDQIVIVE